MLPSSLFVAFWCAAPALAVLDYPRVERVPGSWSVKVTILQLEGDGLDASSKDKMQAMLNQASNAFCLTEEAAKKEDFVGNAMGRKGPGKCTVNRQEMIGDKLELALSCVATDKQGRQVSMTMTGAISPIANSVTMHSERAPTPFGEANLTMQSVSKREGPCTPGQEEL